MTEKQDLRENSTGLLRRVAAAFAAVCIGCSAVYGCSLRPAGGAADSDSESSRSLDHSGAAVSVAESVVTEPETEPVTDPMTEPVTEPETEPGVLPPENPSTSSAPSGLHSNGYSEETPYSPVVLMYHSVLEEPFTSLTGLFVRPVDFENQLDCMNRAGYEYLFADEFAYTSGKSVMITLDDGYEDNYSHLTDEQKKQVEFVQFHPSYDYSDFVEGLRPKINDDGTMGFELQDGIFKKFVARARKNYEDSQKSREAVEKEVTVQESITEFFSGIEFGVDTFKTINGNEFTITGVDDEHINISIPGNATVNRLALNLDEVRKMLESGQKFEKIKDITNFFGKAFATQGYSYDFAIYKAIRAKKTIASKTRAKQEELKKYIFIIDEINRGEISKIFGELFFAIDPGYRGKAGEISTQYSNLHSDPDEKFYIPENVYIIGTMNDIDRSVDSFDFAMRRRFRFVEIRADDRLEMLASLENEELEAEAIRRMAALNKEIAAVEDLNENYQIGASYFLKLKTLDFDQLWTDYLRPLLQEYIHGMYDEEGIMNRFAKAYGYQKSTRGDVNEADQDQG